MNTLPPAFSDVTDRELVAQHLAGETGAFAALVARHQAAVCAVAFSACGDRARSEDLAQETFVRAWHKLTELREPEKLRGWLCGIARHLAREHARSERRTPTSRAAELSADLPADDHGPRERAIGAEERALLWLLLQEIPPAYREPLVLYYREQRSVAAVAAALEISEETVRQRLVRGRTMLGERMEAMVAGSLANGGPGRMFTDAVLAALPIGMVAAKNAAGGKIAAATVVAGVGKAGLASKSLAALGILPVLLTGLSGYLGFRAHYDHAATPAARRHIAGAHAGLHLGLAAGMAGILALVMMSRFVGGINPWIYGVALVLVMGLSLIAGQRWSARQWRKAAAADGAASAIGESPARWEGATFEYRSAATWLGFPLVHIRVGGRRDKPWSSPVRAWIAVGDVALGLVFAGGGFAIAPLSVGGFTFGALSLGGIAVGGVALGGMALGVLAAGGMAAGLAAAGGLTWAVFEHEGFTRGAQFALDVSVIAWGLAWLPPLLLVGWHHRRRTASSA